jgi:hypothetical protein
MEENGTVSGLVRETPWVELSVGVDRVCGTGSVRCVVRCAVGDDGELACDIPL